MARILKSRNIEADTAFSGAEARQRMAEAEYGVVLLDVRLPDESGYGLLGELRALKPDIAVVMISGVDDPELGKAAVEHGAHGYFVKPIGSTELYLAVVNAIRRRRLELEYQANLKRLEQMVAERAEQMQNAAHVQDLEQSVRLAARIMEAPLEVNQAFVTVFHGVFDITSGDVHYIDAGHGHARILRGSTGQENLSLRGAPIGMFPDTEFSIGWANLKPGDTLLVFSDGLLDLRPDMAVKDVLLPADARRSATAQELVDNLTQGVRGREMADDVTVLALRRKWNPKA